MQKIIVLTGPAAAGKNTIAHLFTLTRTRAADIDVDIVRWMYRQPHKAPWEGTEGIEQMKIGVENACLLATSFLEKGLDVVITDVVLNETISFYREKLANSSLVIVKLMPTMEEVMRRLHSRKHTISEEEAEWVYKSQENLIGCDEVIDNTQITAEEVVTKLTDLLDK